MEKMWLQLISTAALLLIFNISLFAQETNADATLSETIEIQFIHASAHEDAFSIDIYVNNDPEGDPDIEGIEYQEAEEFLEFSVDEEISVTVTTSGENEEIFSDDFELETGGDYAAIVRGDPGDDFAVDIREAQKTGDNENEVSLLMYHAVNDLPLRVDVWTEGGDSPLAQNFDFGQAQGYVNIQANTNTFNLYIAGADPEDTDPLGSFVMDATDFGGSAAIFLATGYFEGVDDEDIPGVDLLAAFPDGTTAFPQNITSSEDDEIGIETPQQVTLSQNYPNPFNATTSIEFQIPDDAHAELTIYNTLGQEVETLINERVSAGTHEVLFDASDLSTGIYIYRLNVEGQTITNQMTLVK